MQQLSYNGPSRRYIGIFHSDLIYKEGDEFAKAPSGIGSIQGAAIQTDANDQKWVAAIVHDGTTDHIYCMSDLPNLNGEIYDPVSSPNGWRLIASYPLLATETVYGPWFFNGSGNEAQTLRNAEEESYGYPVLVQDRYKLTVDCNAGTADMLFIQNSRGSDGFGAPVMAVDYIGDEEVLLRLKNVGWFVLDYAGVEKSLIPRKDIRAESYNGSRYGGPNFADATNYDKFGFHATDYLIGEGHSAVNASIYYFDLRSHTVLYSRALRFPDDNSFPNDYSIGWYRLRHQGKLVAERAIEDPVYSLRSLSDPGWYDSPNHTPGGIRGYWEYEDEKNSENGYLPAPFAFHLVVDHQGNLLASIEFTGLILYGSYPSDPLYEPKPLNFISDGDIDGLLQRAPESYSLFGAGVQ